MKTIAILNQKGGVAKTTTALNLGVYLANQGYKTLLVDIDAQANLTMGLGIEAPDKTIYDFFHKEPTIVTPIMSNLDLVPSTIEFAAIELEIINELQREQLLKKVIQQVEKKYDYCVIDCPPSLNMVTINALTAAQSIIIPIEPSLYAYKGLDMMLSTINRVRESINSDLFILGILITKHSERTIAARKLSERLQEKGLNVGLFDTKIRQSAELRNAEDKQMNIFASAPNSSAAADYSAFAKEVVTKLNK